MDKKFGLQHCKKCYLFLIIFGFVILITAINDKRSTISSDKLPWQITLSESGNSQVFGITLNETSMREAFQTLNIYPNTALFAHADGRSTLEAYVSSASLSGLTAKLILEYGVTEEQKTQLIADSVKKEGMPSGAFKYKLNEADLLNAMQAPVISINYIPYADFDEDIILQRFGVAKEIIEIDELSSIYLYPSLGLSISYNKAEKEILQYVSPANFQRLVENAQLALKSQQQSESLTE